MRVLFRSIAQRVVIEYRSAGRAKKEDLQPRLTLLDDQSGEAARYLLAVGTMLSVEDGQEVQAGDVLARVSREASKTRDITGGLPRSEEHTSELQSLMRIAYSVFCLYKKNH